MLIAIVEATDLVWPAPAIAAIRLPFERVTLLALSKALKVQKLLVAVSTVLALVPAPLTVKLFDCPLVSVPKDAALPNWHLNPFVPYVNPGKSTFGFHPPVVESVSPKVDGVNACPSIKLISVKYPLNWALPSPLWPIYWPVLLFITDSEFCAGQVCVPQFVICSPLIYTLVLLEFVDWAVSHTQTIWYHDEKSWNLRVVITWTWVELIYPNISILPSLV